MYGKRSFYDILSMAIADITEHGFDREGRLEYWTKMLRNAALRSLTPAHKLDEMLRTALGQIYWKLIDKGGIAKFHPGVSRFTIEKLAPRLRAELERRIVASANLIKLNRDSAIEKTMQRFVGWGTSVPAGGTDAGSKRSTTKDVRKALARLPFEERRVLIDQGHKLTASINAIVASDGGAIALIWRSNWRQAGYDYREDHKERDGQMYLLRDTWASRAGLVKAGSAGYYEDVTAVGEEVFCRCRAQYVYSLRDLPDDMITKKGRDELERVRGNAA